MRFKVSLFITAMVLTGCAGHTPAPIAPVPANYDITAEASTPLTPARPAASAQGVSSVPSAPPAPAAAAAGECTAGHWRTAGNPAFQEKETWAFDVRWGLIAAGGAVLKVEGVELIRQRAAYHLSMDIQASGLAAQIHSFHDRTDSWLDRQSLTTVLYRHAVREPNYEADETVVLDPACLRFKKQRHRLDRAENEIREGALPADVLDMYGALFYLRTLPLAPGQTYDLMLWASDKAVPVTAVVRRKETISVEAGSFECFVLDIETKDAAAASKIQRVQWWLSTDPAHIPVRIRMDVGIGHITADLKKK